MKCWNGLRRRLFVVAVLAVTVLASGGLVDTAAGQGLGKIRNKKFKGQPFRELASSGGMFAAFGRRGPVQSPGEVKRGAHDNGRGGNSFVNDPCLDPPTTAPFPENFFDTVQSEAEIAVLNAQGSNGKKMVAGYNDSFGFDDNTQGLSGFAYSTNGGSTWIDGSGLPPRVAGAPAGTPGFDAYFGDPVVVVHQATQTFYYSSIYQRPDGILTLSVNRGRFREAPAQNVESVSNTRCLNKPEQFGTADPPSNPKERIIWEPPVEAVLPPNLGPDNADFLDKDWLYVDQNTGTLYVTYTRFTPLGETPIELVRCIGCANSPTFTTGMFTAPTVIVPNEPDEFNQGTQPFTTPTGRLIVTWFARTFDLTTGAVIDQRIEYAYSDDNGQTFTPELLVAEYNPQGEPPGYNRGRRDISNNPYLFVDRGEDDGVFTAKEQSRPGFGNVYITYFSGKTPGPSITPAADIFVSTSTDNGATFGDPAKVNDDNTNTVHVFPSVQANKHGNVYVAWIDRRQDPLDNVFNDTYAAVSRDFGRTFGRNKVQTKVSTSWFVRDDAIPNFGDYNSSELLNFDQFVTIWADGRFPPGTFLDVRPDQPPRERLAATPDVIFTLANGLSGDE